MNKVRDPGPVTPKPPVISEELQKTLFAFFCGIIGGVVFAIIFF